MMNLLISTIHNTLSICLECVYLQYLGALFLFVILIFLFLFVILIFLFVILIFFIFLRIDFLSMFW
jgi:hypothetical protein